MKLPSFTRILTVDIWVLESDDKRLQDFQTSNVPFIEPCFGVVDDFFPVVNETCPAFKESCLAVVQFPPDYVGVGVRLIISK